MAEAKVKRDFTNLDPMEKVVFGRDRIIPSMDTNSYFPLADPALSVLTTLCNKLETTWGNYKNGGVGKKELYEEADRKWNKGFLDEADYVDSVADGNTVIITSGGWDHTSTIRNTRPLPGIVENLRAKHHEQPGTIIIRSKKTKFADTYTTVISTIADIAARIEFLEDQIFIPSLPQPIVIKQGSRVSIKVSNLISGTRYYIYRFARNTTGRGPNCQTITIIAP